MVGVDLLAMLLVKKNIIVSIIAIGNLVLFIEGIAELTVAFLRKISLV